MSTSTTREVAIRGKRDSNVSRADRGLLERRRRHDPGGAKVGGRVAQGKREVVGATGLGERGDRPGTRRVGREPHADAQTGGGGPDGVEHRGEETRAFAPFVLAQVELRVEELLDEVAVGSRDLDPVQPGRRGELGATRIARDQLLDLGRAERPRLRVEARARNRRRGQRGRTRRSRDLLAPPVQELDEEPRPVRLHRGCDPPVRVGDLRQIAPERVRGEKAGRMHGGRLEHDQPDTSTCPRLVVGDEVVGRPVVVHEGRLMRGRDDPVGELHRPELERAEEPFQRH